MSLLRALVSAGEYGPLITLCGEADITTAARLSELVTVKLSGETRHLSMDAAELAYADSMAIHVLLMAANTLKERGGSLVLLRPQGPVARMLELIGVTQLLTIRGETEPEPKL